MWFNCLFKHVLQFQDERLSVDEALQHPHFQTNPEGYCYVFIVLQISVHLNGILSTLAFDDIGKTFARQNYEPYGKCFLNLELSHVSELQYLFKSRCLIEQAAAKSRSCI